MPYQRLLLFDIDGTLLWADGCGRAAMNLALSECFGALPPVSQRVFLGGTDLGVLYGVLEAAGWERAQIAARVDEFIAVFARVMAAIVPQHRVQPCPGAHALLDALAARPEVLLGLTTGNTAATAPIKLRAAGFEPALFRVIGSGSDSVQRDRLAQFALRRAEALTGQRFNGQQVTIVGDTSADVACARRIGARAVIVAAGHQARAELVAARPDVLLDDFVDTEATLRAVLGL